MTSIRRASERDADALLQLWLDAGATPSVTDNEDAIRRFLAQTHGAGFVAETSERIVGSVLAAFDGWRGHLYRLAVLPEHRRAGLARVLVGAAESFLREQGAQRLSALVEGDRGGAQAFWSAVGYAPYEGMRRYTKSV